MADRSYIIEILLQARDQTARAFASAMGQVEAYDKLIDEQKVKTQEAGKANEQYTRQLNQRTTAEAKLAQTLKDSKLRTYEAAKALQDLEAAQKRVAKAEAENDPAKRATALHDVVKAQNDLTDALAQAEGMNRGLATIQANRIAHETALQARLKQTAQIEQENARKDAGYYRDRMANEQAWHSVSDAINKETERSRSDSLKRLAQADAQDSRDRITRRRQEQREIEQMARSQQRAEEQRLASIDRITSGARGPAGVLARGGSGTSQEVRATRELMSARDRLVASGLTVEESERRLRGVIDEEARAYKVAEDAARRMDSARRQSSGGGRRGGGGGTPPPIDPFGGGPAPDESGGRGILSTITSVKQQMGSLDTSTRGFDSSIRNAFGFTVVAMIQPFIALLVGMVGTMASLASAAVAAGTALNTVFMSAMAQGVPVMGVFTAAMQRLTQVISYVTTIGAQAQQQFLARYQNAAQIAMGINQVAIAEHNYSDALFASRQAVYNVRVSELGLLTARQQATRQLEQLILQEESARLAAEASSLAITDAQKALQQAIATGGDVQQAQLQLAQAHVGHQQSVVAAQQAIADAAPGSIARQNISQQVEQAHINVVQAQRAVVDSQFALAQARAAILQARMAATGYNLATAAQLAWLRSQMTDTEKSLAGNILQIYRLFQGVHGYMRPITDAILGAFIPLTSQIYKLLRDPRIFGALLNLGRQIGSAIGTVTRTIFSNRAINNFISLINAAAQNMAPLARIVSGLFSGFSSVVTQAIPFVHQFAGFIAGIVTQFANWASSTRGKNWLHEWFQTAFGALERFISLGLSVVRLVLAVVGVGGGAKSGIGILKELQGWIDRTTSSITHHGKAWHDLQALWSAVMPTVHAVATVIGAIAGAFLQLGTSAQGKRSLHDMADLFAHVLVPAFVQFAITMGKATSALTHFLDKHPALQKMLIGAIALAATVSVGVKAVGLIFGPIAAVIDGLGKVVGLVGKLKGFDLLKMLGAGEGPAGAGLGEIAAVAAPILAVVAAFAALVTWTHTWGNLWNAVKAPFVQFWNQVKKPIDEFVRQLDYMLKPIGGLKGVLGGVSRYLHNDFAATFKFIGDLLGGIGKFIGNFVGTWLRAIGDFFHIIGDLLRGNFKKLPGDFLKLGKDIAKGFINGVLILGGLIAKLFVDLWKQILSFFGISSPSKKGHSLGVQIADGILNGLLSIGQSIIGFGEKIVHWIVSGIKKAPGALLHAITGLIPSPIKSIIHTAGNLLPWNWGQTGGPVGHGYGGGDRFPFMLEGGEHIWTKEEVRSAGGHGSMFAMRRQLGGGGQGGPTGYAVGGAVPQSFAALGLQNPQGQTTQGVTGLWGSVLANLADFIKRSLADWDQFWTDFNNKTKTGLTNLVSEFKNSWSEIDTVLTDSLDKFHTNYAGAFKKFDTDAFNAFWYISNAAKRSLNAFGVRFNPPSLGALPKFASGGWIGQAGEKGRDLVHAMLGRGEAVLNWGQQAFVEPAMRAYYGFGLDKLFQKVQGQHAGDPSGYYGAAARPNKFAAGGYVFPFPQGQPVSWRRIDQGQDMQTTPGGLVVAIAPGIVSPASDRFSGFGGHYATEQITGGPLAGRGVYYGHIWATRFGRVQPGDVIGRTQTRPNQWTAAPPGWLELGFLPYGGSNAGAAIAPVLHALAQGRAIGSAALAGIPGAGAIWNNIAEPAVRGSGVLARLLRAAIGRVTGAANAFGANATNQQFGIGQVGANWRGPWVSVMGQIANKFGWNLPDWKWLVNAESGGDPNAVNSSSGAFGLGQFLGSTARAYARLGALSSNPVKQIEAMAQYILDRYRNPTIAKAFHLAHNWYAKGGFVGNARPIVAHVGEWVVNQAQQSKLASWLGTSKNTLKGALGFSGGPDSFQGGGEVGATSRTGAYTAPTLSIDTTGFNAQAIAIFNRAQALTFSQLQGYGRRISHGIGQFLSNIEKVIGDGGIFALAAQAIQDFVNQQATVVQLAAAGYRISNYTIQRMHGGPQNIVQQATTDLNTTNAEIKVMARNQSQLVTALHDVQRQIRDFGRVTAKNYARYQQLIGARGTLISDLNQADQNLAQAYSDRSTKEQALFQAQLTTRLRPSTIAQGFAQMAQTIAQTLGDPTRLGISDQGVLQAAEAQRKVLQDAYNQAAARARHDPRWQSVADDLLSQLENSITAVAQAQAQALSDAMQAQDTRRTMGEAALGLRDTLAQVIGAMSNVAGPANQYAASAMQIATSQQRTQFLTQQLGAYQGLYSQAQQQGNVGAMNQLSQSIMDLTGQIAQSVLQTQQLITANRQLAVTIMNTQAQATSGFFSAAQGIAQTLGAIAGNQNLPALIAYAKEAGQALIQQGQQAIANIQNAFAPDASGATAFGANQQQAQGFLSQLTQAFQQGPQTFANTLAQLGPQMATFESGLPPDQQTLFQNLVQSLIDNTTATVNNNQQLQQLNATTNQQQFTSSAWQMFRTAIFNGLGGLLPQYALTVPSMDTGGLLASSGLLFGHRGETIIPANVTRTSVGGASNIESHLHITSPTEVADPVYLSNQLAWRLSHDPNVR